MGRSRATLKMIKRVGSQEGGGTGKQEGVARKQRQTAG